jgi:hypothetical protein
MVFDFKFYANRDKNFFALRFFGINLPGLVARSAGMPKPLLTAGILTI